MRFSFIIISLLVLFGCSPSAPLQTSVTRCDSLVAVTFNDTTTLYFSIVADGEASLTWDATEGKKYNTPGRYQHKGRLVVPSQITVDNKVYKVTSIADYALFQQRSLAELYISDGIRHIGNRAISGCDKLTMLRLPKTLETVGDEAFARCKQLVEVSLPDGIRQMGQYAMYDCKRLRKAQIPASMTVVPEGLFRGCFSLEDVSLHSKITTIEERVFSNCENLVKIRIPNSVTEIKDEIFDGCHSLTDVKLSKRLKDIPEACFHDCHSLKEIDLSNIENIHPEAFAHCNTIKEFVLPEGDRKSTRLNSSHVT